MSDGISDGHSGRHLEMTGNVVVEKQKNPFKALSIACPRCGAEANRFCDEKQMMLHAERVVELFAIEAAPLAGPFTE